MEGILRNTKVMGLVDGQVVSVLAFYPDELSSNPGVAYNGIWAYDCIIVFTGRFHFIIKESYFKIKFGLKLLKCQFFWNDQTTSAQKVVKLQNEVLKNCPTV